MASLRAMGYRIEIVAVDGRSTSERNAAQIARAVEAQRLAEGERLVLMGYSKGSPDILVFLVHYPELARQVSAVVSIAGAVNGTAIADRYRSLYSAVAWIGLDGCLPGDRGVLESLRRDVRLRWLSRNSLPRNVAYFSMGAMTTDATISRLLAAPWRQLARVDPRNDGQVVFFDQLVPGSTLLGFANGDHWAVALPLQEKWPYWAGSPAGEHYPRDTLFEAIVLYVAETIAAGTDAERQPAPASPVRRVDP